MAIDELSKRPWVLLPGMLCTDEVFDGFMDHLDVNASQRTVLPMDRPSVHDYHADFDTLSEDTIVCGFSLGALVAAHNANRLNVHSLILFGLNPYADDPRKADGRQLLIHDVQTLGGAAALAPRITDIFGKDPTATRNIILRMADETNHLIEAQTQLALTRPSAFTALENAAMPVVCLTGSQDQTTLPAHGRAAAQAAQKGLFQSLDKLGHFALLEDPAACADAVLRLIETHHGTV